MDIQPSWNIRANLELHRTQAQFYEVTLPYMFNLFEQRKLFKKLESLAVSVPKGSLALDLGSGTGNVASQLERLGLNVVAADLSKQMLAQNPVGNRIVCDAHFVPLKEGKFAIITTNSFFHHVHSPETVLREILRVAAPTCVLYFGCDHFLPSAEVSSPIHWLVTHPKGAVGWILWLASRPKRLGALLAYLLSYRRRHLRTLKATLGAETNDVFLAKPPRQFMQLVQKAGFRVVRLEAREMVAIRRG